MSETISEVRKRAWVTRRANYGHKGHHGSYDRGGHTCQDCERMFLWLVRLHAEGVLSEGQCAKATGLHRVDIRRRVDALGHPESTSQ